MIQRIQTLWLLLASACAFAGLKIAFYTGNLIPEGNATPGATLYQEINGMYSILCNILTIIIAVLAFVAIFLYSNRKLQIKFCIATMFLEITLLINYWFAIKIFKEGSYALGSLLQIAVLTFLFLAIKGISKDKKIVEESDRLR